MKPAPMLGTISGCLVWFILMLIVAPIFFGLSLFVGGFTNLTGIAEQVTAPMVCPKGTTVRVDVAPSTYVDSNGFESPSVANEFNCVDSRGNVIADKSLEQGFLWNAIVAAISLVLSVLFCVLFAAPFGVLVDRLMGTFKKPQVNQG